MLPRWPDDAGELALVVAGHVAAGEVRMTLLCAEKARHEPFRGALDLHGGEGAADPLRVATLSTIALALED